ncbi:MAG TPA: hypothetical protein VH599_06880 [Ktedonobacterales bacterium]|jgi:hypothetical protein
MWKVWSLFIGLFLWAALWFTGNGSSDLLALAALLIFLPLFWWAVALLAAFLIWMKFF